MSKSSLIELNKKKKEIEIETLLEKNDKQLNITNINSDIR